MKWVIKKNIIGKIEAWICIMLKLVFIRMYSLQVGRS